MQVFFYHVQTQTGGIGDLLVTVAIADKSRHLLFAPGEPDEVRQMGVRRSVRRSSGPAHVFALDQKMRTREVS